MKPTAPRTGRGAGHTLPAAPSSAGSQALRAAGRQVLATAGNQVLKAAVDRAVSKVDQTAGRLDAFAAREPRPSRPRVAGEPTARGAAPVQDGQRVGAVRAKVGASLSFVVQRAMLLLQLIQRLARQLLDALARLVHRVRGRADDEGEDGPSTGGTSPSVDSSRTGDEPRAAGAPATARSGRPPQSPRRRPRPEPGVGEVPARRRRPAADHPDRAPSDG